VSNIAHVAHCLDQSWRSLLSSLAFILNTLLKFAVRITPGLEEKSGIYPNCLEETESLGIRRDVVLAGSVAVPTFAGVCTKDRGAQPTNSLD
jgi:hypothetical protein